MYPAVMNYRHQHYEENFKATRRSLKKYQNIYLITQLVEDQIGESLVNY